MTDQIWDVTADKQIHRQKHWLTHGDEEHSDKFIKRNSVPPHPLGDRKACRQQRTLLDALAHAYRETDSQNDLAI